MFIIILSTNIPQYNDVFMYYLCYNIILSQDDTKNCGTLFYNTCLIFYLILATVMYGV